MGFSLTPAPMMVIYSRLRLLDIVCGINAPDSDPEAAAGEPDGTNYAETGTGN
jgi:hypothetical protein